LEHQGALNIFLKDRKVEKIYKLHILDYCVKSIVMGSYTDFLSMAFKILRHVALVWFICLALITFSFLIFC